jgi:hypothetical protein
MTVKLHHTEIPLTDTVMLDAMTATLPYGAELRDLLRPGFDGTVHRYYAEIRTAFTIAADGTVVQCFEVSGVTLEQATRIAAACEDIEEWSVDSFQTIIMEVLGRVGNRMQ